MPGEKAIYYPNRESEILVYYHQAVTQLAGALATKYGITFDTMINLQTHDLNMNHAYELALEQKNITEASTATKDIVFAQAKLDLLRELFRIQDLANFAEPDADLIGMRRFGTKQNLRKVKPVILEINVLEERVIIDWLKGNMQGVIVYGSYTGKRFSEIGRDVRSPFEDLRLNKTYMPEVRYYKLRYFQDDKPVGISTGAEKIIAQVLTPYIEPVVPDEVTLTALLSILLQVELGLNGIGTFDIHWGDGEIETMVLDGSSQFLNHTYAQPGTYDIKVRGTLEELTEVHSNSSSLIRFLLPLIASHIQEIILQNNLLSAEMVNQLLMTVDSLGTSGGVISLIGNASPTGDGITAMNNLIARGWTVLVS